MQAKGGRVAFDTNYRPRGWPDKAKAQTAFRDAMAAADLIFASTEDLDWLYGPDGEDEVLRHHGRCEIVLKGGQALLSEEFKSQIRVSGDDDD